MGAVIGELLPFAVALAAGPIQLIALVLVLVSDGARAKGIGFVTGRVLGLAVVVVATLAILSAVGADHLTHRGSPSTVSSIARIVVGVVLLALAARQWQKRPKPGPPPPSALARRIDTLTTARALLLGLALSMLEPSSVSLGLIAGLDIASARLSAAQTAAVTTAFVVTATVSATVPLLLFLVGGSAARRILFTAKTWLTANERTVMMILFLILGAMLVGRGITDLSG